MDVYFLDLGRALYKSANSGTLEDTLISGIAEISTAEYDDACERNKHATADYLLVNDRAYVIGAHASYYQVLGQNRTAARYSRDNFGIAAVSAILRYGFSDQAVHVVTSHPPIDGQYRDLMKSALLGEWVIESHDKRVIIEINRVFCQEEPVALLRYAQLTDDGRENKNAPVRRRTLIIDGGGQTLDLTATDINGRIVNAMTGSRPIGINHYLDGFETAMRKRYRDFFAQTERIDPIAVREAFASGWFSGGGYELDVNAEAHQQKTSYINNVIRFVADKTGGVTNFDTILLGGGAAGLLNGDLKDALKHGNVHYVDANLANIHTAGVRGLRREYVQWKKMNLV